MFDFTTAPGIAFAIIMMTSTKYGHKLWDNYEFYVYDAGHVTCGLGDMFEFIYQTFKNPPSKPDKWDHIDVYPNFSIWDYDFTSDRMRSGFTILENVNSRGFKSSVRTYLPDGEFVSHVNAKIKTAPIYLPLHKYVVTDINVRLNQISRDTLESDAQGRLSILLNVVMSTILESTNWMI